MNALQTIIKANRAGERRGIPSWCTAHPATLRAILRAYADNDSPILVEATCNQVHHLGGYTGMTPELFRRFVEGLADECGVDRDQIILGGDHLGPNPWRHLPAADAMAEASQMVEAYARAGFSKIHLDASMACQDDIGLSGNEMARRAAELCGKVEASVGEIKPAYVIGTEVPIPGGETDNPHELAVTRPDAVADMWQAHREMFAKHRLSSAFARTIGIVVQPGVDFSNTQVFSFDRAKAAVLSASILDYPGAVFEAHSTDYQPALALAELVGSHFGILKVGPALTFAYRQAIFAMAAIETCLRPAMPSHIVETIAATMDAEPKHWWAYVEAGPQRALAKLYGLSDRMRYYWPSPKINASLKTLIDTIDGNAIPLGILWQYAGDIPDSRLPLSTRIIDAHVGKVVRCYLSACGPSAPLK